MARRSPGIPRVVLLAGAVLVVLAGGLGWYIARQWGANTSHSFSTFLTIRPADEVIGDPKAPIQVYEYTDLQCEYCKQFHDNAQQVLLSHYGKDIVIVFRHDPLPTHPQAYHENTGAECAYEIGGNATFWKFVDRWFATTDFSGENDTQRLVQNAVAVGLDGTRFAACLDSAAPKSRVNGDIVEATAENVKIVPTTIVKRGSIQIPVEGNNIAKLKTVIEYLLTTSP